MSTGGSITQAKEFHRDLELIWTSSFMVQRRKLRPKAGSVSGRVGRSHGGGLWGRKVREQSACPHCPV